MADLDLDAIDPRKATPGQVADLIALVRAKESWIDGAKVDMAALEEAAAKATTWHMEALDDLAACVAERDEARAAIAAIEDLCNEWQLNAAAPTTRGHCADVVREVIDFTRRRLLDGTDPQTQEGP